MHLSALLSIEGLQWVASSLRVLRDEGHQVEDDQGRSGTQCNTGEGQLTEGPGVVRNTHNQRHGGGGQVDLVLEVHAVLAPNTCAEHSNHAVQNGCGTAQNTRRDGCNCRTECGEHG